MQIRHTRLIRTPSLSDLFRSFRSRSYGVDAKGRGAHRGTRVSVAGGKVAHWRWSSVTMKGSPETMERTMVIGAARGTRVHGRDARASWSVEEVRPEELRVVAACLQMKN
jgi:hypothetical protein